MSTLNVRNGSLASVCGLLLGAACLWLLNRYAPHEHFILGREGPHTERLRRIWLFVIAITLHNFPEGLAVGVGFADENVGNALALAIGIGLQNMPEGLAVALALLTLNYTKAQAFLVAFASGMAEPIAGAFGAAAVTLASFLLPWALAFAAGAMIFVIVDEIVPETQRKGLAIYGTAGHMTGLVVMIYLDVALA